jgi:hypothetical protein
MVERILLSNNLVAATSMSMAIREEPIDNHTTDGEKENK